MSTNTSEPAVAEGSNSEPANTNTPAKGRTADDIVAHYADQLINPSNSEGEAKANTVQQDEDTATGENNTQDDEVTRKSKGKDKHPAQRRIEAKQRKAALQQQQKEYQQLKEQVLERDKQIKQINAKLERQAKEYEQLTQLLSNSNVDPEHLYQIGLENQLDATKAEQELQQQLAEWETQQRQALEQEVQQRAYNIALHNAKAQEGAKLQQELKEAQEAYPNVPKELLLTFAAKDYKKPLKEVAEQVWQRMLQATEGEIIQRKRAAANPPAPMRTGGTIPAAPKASTADEVFEHYKKFL